MNAALLASTAAFRATILDRLGSGARLPEPIDPGRMQRFPTSSGRGDTAGWCKLFADLRGGVFGCYRRGISETWCTFERGGMKRDQRAELARQVMAATAERETEQRRQRADNAQRIGKLWAQCVPMVPGDPVTRYLEHRGFGGVWPLSESLRLHRALPWWDGDVQETGTFPAMVAPLVTPEGPVVALHRTYLTADGRKANVRSARKPTGTSLALPHRDIAQPDDLPEVDPDLIELARAALWKRERGHV